MEELNAVEVQILPPVVVDGKVKIDTNFQELQKQLENSIGHYQSMELTDDNIIEVELAKKKLRELRILVDNRQKEYFGLYINPSVDELKTKVKSLQAYIQQVEGHVDSLLEQHDQARINRLNYMYRQYNQEACEQYGVQVDVPLGKEFYLKGAAKKQAELKAKIFEAVRLHKEQQEAKERDKQLVLSQATSLGLPPESYVSMLEFRSVTDILFLMQSHKEEEAKRKAEEEARKAEEDEIKEEENGTDDEISQNETSGLVLSFDSSTNSVKVQEKVKSCVVRLTYKESQRKLLFDFFNENDIMFEIQ